MHLCNHEDTGKTKEKHRPERNRVGECHQCPMKKHKNLQGKCPVLICVDARKKEAPLDQDHKHVKEANQMPWGVLHWVIPEGVNRGPREEIAVVLARELDGTLRKRQAFAKEQVKMLPPFMLKGWQEINPTSSR